MALAILKSLKDLKSFDNDKSVQYLKNICQLYFQQEDEKSRRSFGDMVVKEGGAELLVKIIIGFSKTGFFSNNLVWFSTYYAFSSIWNLSDASSLFAEELGKLGALQHLLAVLDHEPYKNKLKEKNVHFLVKASLGILHNAAKVPHNRPYLRQNNGIQKIAHYTKVDDELLNVVSIMLLGNIIDEDESDHELIMDGSGAVEVIVNLLQGAIDSKDHRFRGYTSYEIADGLTLIATCEMNKKRIFECGAVQKCVKMMKSEDSRDRNFAAKLIWQLAFNETLREKLKENETLMETLDTLSRDTNKDVSNSAQGARWVIQQQAEEKTRLHTESELEPSPGHIMISYQWGNQKTMLKVNNALQKAGMKVWMDVEQMAGSTLQAMAEAVEKACLVLIGVSSKYKDSPNCRTEAEYAFQLRKEIIPLMMEKNYKPDGWLGALLGSKLWIDFSGNGAFEENSEQLIKNIKACTPQACMRTTAVTNHRNQIDTSGEGLALITWTKEDVIKWLKENGLDSSLGAFAEYDGPLIYQLTQLRKEAPEFFFASLRRDLGFSSLVNILKFLRALEKTDGP